MLILPHGEGFVNKHTPGPWAFENGDVFRAENGIGAIVAYLNREDSHLEKGEAEANAHVISAAPCLLVAVQELLAFLPDGKADFETLRFARSAVARAYGKKK